MVTDATTRVKNLSIALEALSRINNEGSPQLYDSIETALNNEIEALWKEQAKTAMPPARPAIPTPDDDIPF